jgi:hypothetical protein
VCDRTPAQDKRELAARAQNRDVATTMICTHVLNKGPMEVVSPSDTL